MSAPPRIVLRVKDPAQATRFYGAVLGFDVLVFDEAHARAELPGATLELVRDDRARLEALHGAGASRHRPGVGVELRFAVADPPDYARRVKERGGFLVEETADRTVVRDGDGYLLTFDLG